MKPLPRILAAAAAAILLTAMPIQAADTPYKVGIQTWTLRNLTPVNLEWLRAVPQGPIRASERALVAHGSPLNEDHYIISMRDAWSPLQRMSTEITFFGHTHVQGAFSQQAPEWQEIRPLYNSQNEAEQFSMEVPVGTRHLVNPGSVGQPRDGDWRAAYALFDTDAQVVHFHRTPYNLKSAQDRIFDAKLPARLATRLASGR